MPAFRLSTLVLRDSNSEAALTSMLHRCLDATAGRVTSLTLFSNSVASAISCAVRVACPRLQTLCLHLRKSAPDTGIKGDIFLPLLGLPLTHVSGGRSLIDHADYQSRTPHFRWMHLHPAVAGANLAWSCPSAVCAAQSFLSQACLQCDSCVAAWLCMHWCSHLRTPDNVCTDVALCRYLDAFARLQPCCGAWVLVHCTFYVLGTGCRSTVVAHVS